MPLESPRELLTTHDETPCLLARLFDDPRMTPKKLPEDAKSYPPKMWPEIVKFWGFEKKWKNVKKSKKWRGAKKVKKSEKKGYFFSLIKGWLTVRGAKMLKKWPILTAFDGSKTPKFRGRPSCTEGFFFGNFWKRTFFHFFSLFFKILTFS